MASLGSVEVRIDKELIEIIDKLREEVTRLRRFEAAMERMAEQFIHPKITAEEMVESILKAKKL